MKPKTEETKSCEMWLKLSDEAATPLLGIYLKELKAAIKRLIHTL